MKYIHYKVEDFVQDEYFQKWILEPDPMTDNFWNNWLGKNPGKRNEINEARRLVRLLASGDDKLTDADFDKMWQNIIERKEKPGQQILAKRSSSKIKWVFVLKVAAVFVGVFGMAYEVYQSGILYKANDLPALTAPQITLELQDGTVKVVDENSSGAITTSKGQKLGSYQQNILKYEKETTTTPETLVFNQLTVPNGKKTELELSDGTHILLNSGSKLRYPVTFLKNKPRDVYLDGEAFFSVKEDKARPFTVVTDKMNTRVYGTKFNVTSYKNENNTATVLIEGSVGVYHSNNDKGDEPVTMVPGQRAVFENETIDVEKVNISKYVAWTEGKLFFIDDRFELILKKLERHFNVHINNRFTALNEKKYTGTFTDESLEEILMIWWTHTPFDYSIEGNTIVIKPRN